jgi:hypothetical protein
MGFTKKQRRDQRKHQFTPVRKVKKQRAPRDLPTEQPKKTGDQRAMPEHVMLLVKTTWSEAGEASHEVFQLIELVAGKNQEQLRQEILAQLQAQGKKDGDVEIFDPDNVPPGTIPPDAQVTPGKSPFSAS